jgi:hypothetical protein
MLLEHFGVISGYTISKMMNGKKREWRMLILWIKEHWDGGQGQLKLVMMLIKLSFGEV